MTYLEAVRLGREAFYNGHPKVYPGTEDGYIRSGWHEGWFNAWRASVLGELKLAGGTVVR